MTVLREGHQVATLPVQLYGKNSLGELTSILLTDDGSITISAVLPTTVGSGTVALLAGVAKQVSVSSVPCKRLWLSPVDTNASEVRVGGSGILVTTGKQLYQGEDFDFEISDLSAVWLISASNATVTYMYTV